MKIDHVYCARMSVVMLKKFVVSQIVNFDGLIIGARCQACILDSIAYILSLVRT